MSPKSVLAWILLSIIGWNPEALRLDRATNQLTIELLVIADYSTFNWYYQMTSSSASHSSRVSEAQQKAKQHISTLVHSSNNVYNGLESDNIYISIQVVDILVMASKSDSPWTENVKVSDGQGSYTVDPDNVFPLLKPHADDLQRTVPHDHAMIITRYDLRHGRGSTFSGYANIDAECTTRSISLVEDDGSFYTAQLIAHEIGHSLGCEHDGDGNNCPTNVGYTMETNFILHNKNKWTFSSCSVDYIRAYLQDLNTDHNNCLKTDDNSHPDNNVLTMEQQWYGEVYSLDDQCKLQYGDNSYLCRNQYDGDYTSLCLKLYCYDPSRDSCYYHDGGDGSPCGAWKWCMSNECVYTSHASANVSGTCVAGDQPGVVYNGRTCQEITTSHPSDCSHHSVTRKCCDACTQHTTFTSSTDVDGQCANKHGTGSTLCRGASAYDGRAYSEVVCSDLQCSDPSRDDWCLSTTADDKTSCGNRKWCVNGACVDHSSAPAVPDNCPWGDEQGVVTHGLTCAQVAQPEHNWRCYSDYTAKVCCAACNSVHRNVQGCEYGDTSDWCVDNIPDISAKRMCYFGHNADLCCESCTKYNNAAHHGCEYGDHYTNCQASRCHSYSTDHRNKCCETCRDVSPIG